MPRTLVTDAIVLKTYDVGEADRFCVLFTKELGRVTARAAGVRRMTSRMGGSLLPCQVVQVQLKESSAGYMVAGVSHKEGTALEFSELKSFSRAQEGVELLMMLTHNDEPIPHVYDATVEFLRRCSNSEHQVLAYTLRLLAHLGLMPEGESLKDIMELNDAERDFVGAAILGSEKLPSLESTRKLDSLCRYLLRDHVHAPLKAAGVGASLRN